MAAVSALSLLQDKKLLMAAAVSATEALTQERGKKEGKRKSIDPEDANETP